MYNILLEIDGSADALAALDVAMSITLPTIAVTPHYVLNTQAIWKFVGMEKPGLIGSGPYFQAFGAIKASLYDLMDTVSESYQARCSQFQHFADLVIDEGDFVCKINERATELRAAVLIGKTTLFRNAEATNKTIAEITHGINSPLIVIDQAALFCGCGCFRLLSADAGQYRTEPLLPETLNDLLAAAPQTYMAKAA
ncbi:MAG: hypothetical protein K2X27_03230 [Candidatus Obscuribacterales bacterium]|nr:hypothetical protein [Candidatus Obscuribacterales bacterium]